MTRDSSSVPRATWQAYHGEMVIRSFNDVVNNYIRRFHHRLEDELGWFARQPSLDAVIERAALARNESGKLSHQWRVPNDVLRAWADALLERRSRIRRSRTFAELHDTLSEAGAQLHGIGSGLAVYDTATRIGAFLKLEPELVYLHRGTRDGARALGFRRRDSLSAMSCPSRFDDCRLTISRTACASTSAKSQPSSAERRRWW